MDILLIFYCLLFLFILIAPTGFVFYKFKDKNTSLFGDSPDEFTSNLKEERLILLSNLADLKAEEETGKLKQGEFQDLSKDILVSLSSIDDRLMKVRDYPMEKSDSKVYQGPSLESRGKVELNFCPQCGSQLIPAAKFCHSCGYKLTS